MKPPANPRSIQTQAAAWLARRDAGMSDAERAEFARWCAADPRHASAVNEITAAWNAFDRPLASGQGDALRQQLATLQRRDRRRWMAGSSIALAAAACLAVIIFLQRPIWNRAPAAAGPVTARVIQPERRTLPDGSVVELKPGAEMTVAFTPERRTVVLQKGVAHFAVAKNPNRPFIVDTGKVSVRAVGTAFVVERGQSDVEVLVTEGRVSVDATPAAPVAAAAAEVPGRPHAPGPVPLTSLVDAGQRTVIPLENVTTIPAASAITPAEMTEHLAWRVPWLDFSETSVADAIAMFNTYHHERPLRTGDPTIAALRVTGLFRSDNLTGFVRALETSLGVRAEYRDHEIRLYRGS